ncbi:MAG: hypothetical protein WCL02_02295 [bacterium]
METQNKPICAHPFYTEERMETKIIQELCNLGILDTRHALLCYSDAATLRIGYLNINEMDPTKIPFFEQGCIEIYLYNEKNSVSYQITTLKQMELISLLYNNWSALVTVLLKSVSEVHTFAYENAQKNVAKWNDLP